MYHCAVLYLSLKTEMKSLSIGLWSHVGYHGHAHFSTRHINILSNNKVGVHDEVDISWFWTYFNWDLHYMCLLPMENAVLYFAGCISIFQHKLIYKRVKNIHKSLMHQCHTLDISMQQYLLLSSYLHKRSEQRLYHQLQKAVSGLS